MIPEGANNNRQQQAAVFCHHVYHSLLSARQVLVTKYSTIIIAVITKISGLRAPLLPAGCSEEAS